MLQSKNDLFLNWQEALYRNPEDNLSVMYSAEHRLTAEFEEQTIRPIRTYKGDREYLSVSHPVEPDARDDAPDSTALSLFAGKGGGIGEILVG